MSIALLLHVLWCQHLTFSDDNVSPYYFLVFFTDEFDSYIVVSFINATLVLSIGETVEEVTDSGFLGTTPTLSCSQLGEDALLQVLGSCWSQPRHWNNFSSQKKVVLSILKNPKPFPKENIKYVYSNQSKKPSAQRIQCSFYQLQLSQKLFTKQD